MPATKLQVDLFVLLILLNVLSHIAFADIGLRLLTFATVQWFDHRRISAGLARA